jgi:hypothetical protein
VTELNKKGLAISLVVVLAVFIGVAAFAYFQNQQTGTYTIIGTLQFAPGHAIEPGISATSIRPSVSPWPSNITFHDVGFDESATSFVYLHFSDKFTYTPGTVPAFPEGFGGGMVVQVSGELGYNFDNYSQTGRYVMNVTSITHYTP